ncbi:MAG: DNA polymerase IV [Anaerolineaceae bacterium]|nr:DNA polymerase IV [Anaerolineaceae bacterium]
MEKKPRLIFHCDCNNFFASCEILERPELRDVPMAVAGDPENRLGVVVAKNELAKKRGVKTTDTVWQAKKKCPGIVFVPPRHHYYKQISDRVNAIYHDYTDFVEPASIDESYLDMTGAPEFYHLSPRELADSIRERVKKEIGITISVGVSFNKVFAKMGSDYKKPDATTVITEDNFKEILWPLPVSDLLFAGRASVEALNKKSIRTIGDLAAQPKARIQELLGKGGEMLWQYANGLDAEPVRKWGEKPEIKSVSRGMTFKRDLVTKEEIMTGVSVLVDEIAASLRSHQLKGSVISVQIKAPDMRSISRQTSLDHATYLQHEIQQVAMDLIESNWRIGERAPIRAFTVGVTKLIPAAEETEQVSLFDLMGGDQQKKKREKQDKLEAAVYALRKKMGDETITLGFQKNDDIGIHRKT